MTSSSTNKPSGTPPSARNKPSLAPKTVTPAVLSKPGFVAPTGLATPPLAGAANGGVDNNIYDEFLFLDAYRADHTPVSKASIAHFLDADEPNPLDPKYPDYLRYLEQEATRLKNEDLVKGRNGANSEVSSAEATQSIGALVKDESDTMTIHTAVAQRLFLGRQADEAKGITGMSGAKRVAASLLQLYYLSSNNNPYADWLLIEFTSRVERALITIKQSANKHLALLDAQKNKGLNYSVLRSSAPISVSLGFRTPYAFALANLLVELDYSVRLVRSSSARSLISSDDDSKAIETMLKPCRQLFEYMKRAQVILSNDNLRPLSRKDWIDKNTNELAAKRVMAITSLMGEIPREILISTVKPRHARNPRLSLSDDQFKALNNLPLADGTEEHSNESAV